MESIRMNYLSLKNYLIYEDLEEYTMTREIPSK